MKFAAKSATAYKTDRICHEAPISNRAFYLVWNYSVKNLNMLFDNTAEAPSVSSIYNETSKSRNDSSKETPKAHRRNSIAALQHSFSSKLSNLTIRRR